MTVTYTELDANPAALDDQHVAILGYGNLGRAMALNLRDSGLVVVVGNADDEYAERARVDGFEVVGLAEAAAAATLKVLLLPDEIAPHLYLVHVSPTLKAGDSLVFASGYAVAFGFIEPPPFVDVMLIAPRSAAFGVRAGFQRGAGFPSFVGVSQDASGRAWERLLGLAYGLGGLRRGAMELTFRQEAELDLFTQQTVLPALHHLLHTAADVLIKEGYPPEAALLDLYVSNELGDLLNRAAQVGLMQSIKALSPTAQYGLLSRLERYNEPKVRRQMELTLTEIRSGKFAQEWAADYADGYLRLETIRQKRDENPLWKAEREAIEQFRPPDDQRPPVESW